MDAEMEFRQAGENDFAALAALRWEARAEGNGETPAVGRDRFLEACVTFLQEGSRQGDQISLVAARGQLLVAHLALARIRLFPRPAKVADAMGIITENYTRPAFRNQGIGGRLLRRGIGWARAQDFELLIVFPSERAVPFYQRAGFRPTNEVMALALRPYYSERWAEEEGGKAG